MSWFSAVCIDNWWGTGVKYDGTGSTFICCLKTLNQNIKSKSEVVCLKLFAITRSNACMQNKKVPRLKIRNFIKFFSQKTGFFKSFIGCWTTYGCEAVALFFELLIKSGRKFPPHYSASPFLRTTSPPLSRTISPLLFANFFLARCFLPDFINNSKNKATALQSGHFGVCLMDVHKIK